MAETKSEPSFVHIKFEVGTSRILWMSKWECMSVQHQHCFPPVLRKSQKAPVGAITGEKEQGRARYGKNGSIRVFPSKAGLEPGRQGEQGEQGGSRCGKLYSSRIERKAGGWLWGAGALRPALRSKESELQIWRLLERGAPGW